MKQFTLCVALLGLSLSGCNRGEIEKLKNENTKLEKEISEQKQALQSELKEAHQEFKRARDALELANQERELSVELPEVSNATPLTKTEAIVVNIDRQGRYLIGEKMLTREKLKEVLLEAVKNNPLNQSVVIRADQQVLFQHVATVMQICNKTGIRDYEVAVDTTED